MTASEHPYKQYEKLGIWKIVEKAVADLVDNGDLAEKTDRAYIVGYLTKVLVERRRTVW